ncbi:hypothetical protein F5X96DRAFT_664746 [Biscogniauxia mediterranea]|nr:hypothetical protein F5X96DRAFT_664746 [Biscogniauxia mediterranea]
MDRETNQIIRLLFFSLCPHFPYMFFFPFYLIFICPRGFFSFLFFFLIVITHTHTPFHRVPEPNRKKKV